MSDYEKTATEANDAATSTPSTANAQARPTRPVKPKRKAPAAMSIDDMQSFLRSAITLDDTNDLNAVVGKVEAEGQAFIIDYSDASIKAVVLSPEEYGRRMAKRQ